MDSQFKNKLLYKLTEITCVRDNRSAIDIELWIYLFTYYVFFPTLNNSELYFEVIHLLDHKWIMFLKFDIQKIYNKPLINDWFISKLMYID